MSVTGAYDDFCDVLYVSLTDPPRGKGVRSRTARITAILRTDGETGKLVGITIEAAQHQTEHARDCAP